MKKITVFSIIFSLLLLFSAISAYFYIAKRFVRRMEPLNEGVEGAKNGSDEMIPGTYNFGLKESPWLDHMDTKINTTYEAVINTSDYFKNLRCTGESSEEGTNPYAPVKAVCLKGGGARMIIPSPYYYVFNSPKEGGFFEQDHMLNQISYFNDDKFNTKFFVVPFGGYEVPTSYPAEALVYLPAWKEMFLRSNGMSEDYFNSHIFAAGFFVSNNMDEGSVRKEAVINYYYQVDWAYVRLGDTLNIEGGNTKIAAINSIEHLASQEQIKEAVQAVSPALGFDVAKDLALKSDGRFAMRLYGTISEKDNKCIFGIINLEDASITEIQDTACYVE